MLKKWNNKGYREVEKKLIFFAYFFGSQKKALTFATQYSKRGAKNKKASVAQLVEQLTCNQ